ncbi:MAG: LuxR C-terminal-related transcriptional regulator [Bacteroidia bacterium]
MTITLPHKASLALVDDHQLFLEGLSLLISRNIKNADISTFMRPRDVMNTFGVEPPDLVITDLSMPYDGGGISLIQNLRDLHKEVPILVVSMNTKPAPIKAVVAYGANGFVPKDAPEHVLMASIEALLDGKSYFPPAIQEMLDDENDLEGERILKNLTFREKEILGLVAREMANQEIAEKLKISKRTVETHRKNIMRKLGVKNSVGLAKFAYRFGITD